MTSVQLKHTDMSVNPSSVQQCDGCLRVCPGTMVERPRPTNQQHITPALPRACAPSSLPAYQQDIRTALLGLEGILRLMRQQTGPLIESHKRAHRAALLAGPTAPASPLPPSSTSSAAAAAGAFSGSGWGQGPAAAGGPSSGSSSSYHTCSPSQAASAVITGAASSSSTLPPSLGPLAAAKLANTAQGSPTAAGAAGRVSDRGSGGGFVVGHHSRQSTGGSTSGSTFDDEASYGSAGGGGSPNWAASKVVGSGAASPAAAGAGAAGAAGVLGGIGCMRRTAQDVAAAGGGGVEAQEPILLRVLCHRWVGRQGAVRQTARLQQPAEACCCGGAAAVMCQVRSDVCRVARMLSSRAVCRLVGGRRHTQANGQPVCVCVASCVALCCCASIDAQGEAREAVVQACVCAVCGVCSAGPTMLPANT